MTCKLQLVLFCHVPPNFNISFKMIASVLQVCDEIYLILWCCFCCEWPFTRIVVKLFFVCVQYSLVDKSGNRTSILSPPPDKIVLSKIALTGEKNVKDKRAKVLCFLQVGSFK